MLLTAVGLYGALAFSVARRTREIGVRMALGARADRVQMLIVREGMAVVCFGAAVGVALAWSATRLLTHQLYGSAAGDWMFYAAGAAAVCAAGLIACWIPSRRAAAVEPLVALRCE